MDAHPPQSFARKQTGGSRPLADVRSIYDAALMKPWNMVVGIAIGSAVGALAWWSSYVPGAGMFQNMQLILVPIALAIVIVSIRNKHRKVGPYEHATVARNKQGVL